MARRRHVFRHAAAFWLPPQRSPQAPWRCLLATVRWRKPDLIATIQKLGGKPVEEKKLDDYAKALNAGALKNQADVLDLAARLELGATNAYLGVIPSFKDTALAKVAARLAADETMHWSILANALGRPLPAMALSFGA